MSKANGVNVHRFTCRSLTPMEWKSEEHRKLCDDFLVTVNVICMGTTLMVTVSLALMQKLLLLLPRMGTSMSMLKSVWSKRVCCRTLGWLVGSGNRTELSRDPGTLIQCWTLACAKWSF